MNESVSLAREIGNFLETVRDQGTPLDTGGGDDMGDIWVTVQGVEYFISVRPSNAEKNRN